MPPVGSLLIGLVFTGTLGFLGARVMNNRGQPGWLYGVLIFVALPVGVIAFIYGVATYSPVIRVRHEPRSRASQRQSRRGARHR